MMKKSVKKLIWRNKMFQGYEVLLVESGELLCT